MRVAPLSTSRAASWEASRSAPVGSSRPLYLASSVLDSPLTTDLRRVAPPRSRAASSSLSSTFCPLVVQVALAPGSGSGCASCWIDAECNAARVARLHSQAQVRATEEG